MALNIKNPEVERLAAEVAAMAETDRRPWAALQSRTIASPIMVSAGGGGGWAGSTCPAASTGVVGAAPMSKEEREAILGYGPDGV